uniref:Si:ch1073-416j23.1 n=1 Tax=Kryptolebias marmoratus TaxID=37003 RepID=A0A3Q3EPK7_KRYMA
CGDTPRRSSDILMSPCVSAEFLEVVKNFEVVRKSWLRAEVELKNYKELLVKSDVAKAALEIKLKHARNQLDVEMKKRHKIETRQMQLICDILVHDSKSSACLNDEQKSLLATFDHRGANVTLSVIDESSFLSHSDISYDRTDDDLDLDTTMIKPLRSRARERRVGSVGSFFVFRTAEGFWLMSFFFCPSDQTTSWSPNTPTTRVEPEAPPDDRIVIRPETCTPCGKRIRFGKMVVKCRNCRVVAHPECKQKLSDGCSSSSTDLLEAFAPLTHPRVPQLVVDCVAEIERRGLHEKGLYRVPGGERAVKELRDRVLQGKPALLLSKVQDIHVVCGLLKDFLRRLKEPLVTFRLHRTFMEASELDEDNSAAVLYRVISELPKSNRDTLAFLMLHLHKVVRSPHCQMDQNNLARVFGPTIVGHGMSEPTPTTIMRDTNVQPKASKTLIWTPGFWLVLGLMVLLWFFSGRLFLPLTSPETNNFYKMSSRESVRGRLVNPGTASSRA